MGHHRHGRHGDPLVGDHLLPARRSTGGRPGGLPSPDCAKAASGSSKNITPKRLTTTSNGWSKEAVWASPWVKSMSTPRSSARRRATSSMGAERSRPVTRPPGPTARAASRLIAPLPHPTSKTRSPNSSAAAVSSRRPKGASMESKRSASVTQTSAGRPFQYLSHVGVRNGSFLVPGGPPARRRSWSSSECLVTLLLEGARCSTAW